MCDREQLLQRDRDLFGYYLEADYFGVPDDKRLPESVGQLICTEQQYEHLGWQDLAGKSGVEAASMVLNHLKYFIDVGAKDAFFTYDCKIFVRTARWCLLHPFATIKLAT